MATPIPSNTAEFSLSEVAEATGGALRCTPELARASVRGVTTDSRGELGGKLFVALGGERFDGHRFVADALARGAVAAVVRRGALLDSELPVCEVEDPLLALGALARLHRRRWGGRVVAIGGSAGKTTTRSVLTALLAALAPGAICYAAGNLNNRVGVPMVLLTLGAAHRLCVVEVGTNQRGEVAELAAVAEPDVAVLTLVALEHAGGIGDLDAIEAEEGALLRALPPQGAAVANADDPRALRQLEQSRARTRVPYGRAPAARYRIVARHALGAAASHVTLERPTQALGAQVSLVEAGSVEAQGVEAQGVEARGVEARGAQAHGANGAECERLELVIPLLGEPAALALAAAVAVTDLVAPGLASASALRNALASVRLGEPGRLVPIELGDGTLVLDDTYNANPGSMASSIAVAAELCAPRRARLVLVLGEMLELGACSKAEHAALAALAADAGARLLVAVAGDAAEMVEPARRLGVEAVFAADSQEALAAVLGGVAPGEVVLVKGSRGVRAETVVEGLVRARGRAA